MTRFWSSFGLSARADAGGDDAHVGAEQGAQFRRLEARGNHAIGARLLGLQGAVDHQVFERQGEAHVGQIILVEGGEHGHREDQRFARTGLDAGVDRSADDRGIAGDGQEFRAGAGDIGGGITDRRGDIGQLRVEEDFLPQAEQFIRQGKAATEHLLQADLVEGDRVAQGRDHVPRIDDARHIERDDQPVAQGDIEAGRHISHGRPYTFSSRCSRSHAEITC